ncbi:MAG TPA: CvpA family protein [Saprospiraceae bacterium]|nr:CvpA family protein [Saprospiraceae bacterium]
MIIDLILIVVIIYGLYLGFQKEPLKSVFKIFPYLIGTIVAIYLSPYIYDRLAEMWGKNSVILFLIVIIITFLIGSSFTNYLVEKITRSSKKAGIKKPEKTINAITTSFILIIAYSMIVTFCEKSNLLSDSMKNSSVSITILESLPLKIKASAARMKPGFTNFYNKSNELIKEKD